MNIANKLTVFRIFLVFPAVFFILCEHLSLRWICVFLIFLIACYTDHLDGKIARKCGKITDFGKIMDPLADKMLIISMFICFVGLKLSPIFPVVLIVMREFIVTSMRLLLIKRSGTIVPANIFGKLKTVSQMLAVGIIIIWQMYIEMVSSVDSAIFSIAAVALIWISAALSLISGGIYIFKSRKFLIFN